jgi:predicted metal-dependent hydrolase
MTALVVRRLLVDLQTPIVGHWNGGDAFRTAFFNALSMSFPAGEQAWRLRIFRIVSGYFVTDLLRQTAANLWRDGSWWRPSTWAGGWRLLFGRQGLVRLGFEPWRRYLRTDFQPSQGDGASARRWLAEHAALAPPVRTPS